MTNYILA